MGELHEVNGFEIEVDFGAGGRCPFDQRDQDGIEDAVISWVRENVTELPADEDGYQDLTERLEKHIENTYWAERQAAEPEAYDYAEPYWWGRGEYGGYCIHISRDGERWKGESAE